MRHRLSAAIVAALLLLCGAATAQQRLLLVTGRQGIPTPVLDLNFANNVGYNGGTGATAASFLTVARAGTATDLMPTSPPGYLYQTFAANTPRLTPGLGLLLEGTRVNSALNSVNPTGANVATASLANATYVLWMNGTGSVTMSAGTATGCSTATVTNGTFATFTTTGTAGTCLLTFAGSVNAVQVEAGTAPSSFVVTTAAAVTRAVDLVTVNSPPSITGGYTLWYSAAFFAPINFASGQAAVQIDNGANTSQTRLFRNLTNGNAAVANTGGVGSQTNTVAFAPNLYSRHAASVQTNLQISNMYAGNETLSFSAAAFTPLNTFTTLRLGGNATGNNLPCFCYLAEVKEWLQPLTTSQLKQITR